MTTAEASNYLSEEAFAKRQRAQSIRLGISLLAAFVAIALGLQAFFVNNEQGTTINKYTNSACAKAYPVDGSTPDPTAVQECEALRVEIARREGVAGPCVLYQRVTGKQGANCPRFFVANP